MKTETEIWDKIIETAKNADNQAPDVASRMMLEAHTLLWALDVDTSKYSSIFAKCEQYMPKKRGDRGTFYQEVYKQIRDAQQ